MRSDDDFLQHMRELYHILSSRALISIYQYRVKMDLKLVLITAIAVSCVGVGLFCQVSTRSEERRSSAKYVKHVQVGGEQPSEEQVNVRSMRRGASKRINNVREKPKMLEVDDEEMAELTDLAKKLLVSLQAALDADDFEQIKSILAMIEHSPKGVLSKTANGLPVYLRRKLVEALGWFGAEGMPEIVDFLGDENSEVAEAAIEQFELALEDITLGDRARAEIVVMASKALHDHDALERIFMEISNMRNSVAIPTLVEICQTGTEEARDLMPETIPFVTGTDEGEIATVEDMEKWLGENPDGEDDEDLYGPMDVD